MASSGTAVVQALLQRPPGVSGSLLFRCQVSGVGSEAHRQVLRGPRCCTTSGPQVVAPLGAPLGYPLLRPPVKYSYKCSI